MSAQQGVGLEFLLEELVKIEKPKYPDGDFLFLIARSFDANKPGVSPEGLAGGVIGGSVVRGKLKKGDEVIIKPVSVNDKYVELKTKIKKIKRGDSEVEEADCGGLVALETSLDPNMARSDKLVGCVVGTKTLPETINELETEYKLFAGYELKTGDILLATSGNCRSTGKIVSINPEKLKVELKLPICADKGSKVSYSKLVEGKWHLVGWGNIN